MRMSCNGCRILRKGCSEDCSIRPCLQWIKSPESQANATVFLAKFYGRAGLMNLINAGPEHLRPAIFRSLLYEACGRIVNPIYGSVGLLWSGSWQLCQAAVENVLKGQPITPITSEAAASGHGPPLKAYDIRHVSKDENSMVSNDLNKSKTRYRFKRSGGAKQVKKAGSGGSGAVVDAAAAAACFEAKPYRTTGSEFNRSASHDSSLSHQSEAAVNVDESKESEESMVSSETAEATVLFRAEPESSAQKRAAPVEEIELTLELTLGLESSSSSSARAPHVVPVKKRRVEALEGEGACELGLP